MDHKWYIAHAQSGKEKIACKTLLKRVEEDGVDFVLDAFVPEYKETYFKNGKKKTNKKRSFPGYIYILVDYSKESAEYCMNTPYISQFVKQGDDVPRPVPESEVSKLKDEDDSSAENLSFSMDFQVDQKVLIVDGPFNNFNGTIKAIYPDKRKISVNVEIFGRITPVEIDYFKVKKV